VRFSGAADGVLFDFAVTGTPQRIAWPRTGDNAWLVLDRNGNGTIDNGRELFGNRTQLADGTLAPHGFDALAELDLNGDGVIDRNDAEFERLALWRDTMRDGISERSELLTLRAAGVVAISVNYRESRRTDEYGNVLSTRPPGI